MDQPEPTTTTEEVCRPDPAYKKLSKIVKLIFSLIVGAIVLVVELISGGLGFPGWIAAVLFTSLVLASFSISRIRYASLSYMVRAHDIVACKGVLWRTRVCIPRSRLQHVDVGSGPLERRYGLCHLELFTAGSPTAAATLPGLTPQRAEELRAELTGVRDVPPAVAIMEAHG